MNTQKNMKKASITRGIVVLVLIALAYLLPFSPLGSENVLRVGLIVALYCTLGQMWNLMSGYAGMTSLGNQIFIGIAGYSVAVFATTFGLPFGWGILCGGVLSALMAIALSMLLFRMRGMYFAIATWVTAEALKIIFTSWTFVKQGAGMAIKIRPYPSTMELYFFALTLAVLAIILVFIILNSRIGLGLTAMRDDADAASSVGVNLFSTKLFCFTVSAFVTGVAGALFYINQGSIFPTNGFGIQWTVAAVFIVIIGGIGTISGPILGAFIYVALSELLSKWPGYSMIVLGVIAILVILGMPNGVLGTLERKFGFELLSSRRRSHHLY